MIGLLVMLLSLLSIGAADPGGPLVIAHRGGAGVAPENTLAAIDRALRAGADGVEVDVRRSADGRLVVMHDARVGRTTDGRGRVARLTWDELQALDAGSWFDPRFEGERIPSLDEVLAHVVAADAYLFIELKSPQRYPGIEHQVLDLVAAHGAEDRVHILSFHHPTLRRIASMEPRVTVSGLWRIALPRVTRSLGGVNAWFLPYRLRPGAIEGAHDRGDLAMAWGVNRPEDAAWLARHGIDGLTTDFPEQVAARVSTEVVAEAGGR